MVLQRVWSRWIATALIFVGATWLNLHLQPELQNRAPLLPYFPALVVVGLLCGCAPAIALLAVSCGAILYFWVAPFGEIFPIAAFSDIALVALFFVAGSLVAAVSALARRLLDREHRTAQRLTLALTAGRMVAWEWDATGGFGASETGARTLFGYAWRSMDEMEQGMSPADAQVFRQRWRRAWEEGGRFSWVGQIDRPDGGARVWMQVDGVVELDAHRRPLRAHGVAVDVSELAETQDQLRRESQRKDAFLATLAHELRNPMAPIRYAAAILQRAESTPTARQRAISIIERQSAHMSRLLDDLLDMSRITRNVVELQRRIVDLRAVVRHALEAVEPLFAERRHELTLTLPSVPVLVDGDATRLQQVLGNLLDNAAKYSEPGGRVEVRLSARERDAEVLVSDQGRGFAPEKREEVFELFSRIDADGLSPAGLGIGLAVSRQLVQLHGGTLEGDSAGPGSGSRFTLRLPLIQRAAGPVEEGPPQGPEIVDGEQLCVLVVDDNVDGAQLLATLLRGEGYRAAEAHDGREALSAFRRIKPAVVLLDIGLPDMRGTEVARRIRSECEAATPVLIAVTGWGQQADRDATAEAGFDAHVLKPVDIRQLHALIQSLTGD